MGFRKGSQHAVAGRTSQGIRGIEPVGTERFSVFSTDNGNC